MPRRLRARDDVGWIRVCFGAGLGVALALALPFLGYHLSLWTHDGVWLGLGAWAIPVAAVLCVCIAFRSIWSRIIAGLLCLPAVGYVFLVAGLSYGCSLQLKLSLPGMSCL